MQIYLPIAEIPVNVFLILLLGLATGFLAGMFGIGGGFLATPLLIFIGIPPAIAVSTSTNQIIAASVSGFFAQLKHGNVDIKLGLFLALGGFFGSVLGISIFRALQKIGQIDVAIGITYVLFLGTIGIMMLVDGSKALLAQKGVNLFKNNEQQKTTWIDFYLEKLPFKIYFPTSDIFVSALVPMILSFGIAILVALMGIGGGFLMIPAMIYILKMPSHLLVGTSLFQIIFVASNTTFLQAITSSNVDIVLSVFMIVSSAIGAQFGSRFGSKFNASKARLLLALILILVCTRMLMLLIATPRNLYSIEILQ